MNFNWKIYREFNKDLVEVGLRNHLEFTKHFSKHGIKEGRLWRVYDKYPDFNYEIYRTMYVDLLLLNKAQLEEHWVLYGSKQGRKYKNYSSVDEKYYSFIDGILYINLEKREDRRREMISELERVNLPMNKVERVEAVYNELGTLGCTRSHIKCLEYAKAKGWKNVMILEDDFNFVGDGKKIEEAMDEISKCLIAEDVGLVMLAGNIKKVDDYNDFLDKAVNVLTTSGYIIKSSMYDAMLNNLREGERLLEKTKNIERYSLDVWWNRLNGRYILKERIGYQRRSYSDIVKGEREYGC